MYPMKDKVLYLHIGTHKTGTTALQTFFSLNRRKLRAHGIIYPYDRSGGSEGGHFRLYWSLLKGRGVRMQRFPHDLGTCQQEWQAVLNQCDRTCGLVSAEGLWLCKPEDIEMIRQLTAGYEVKIVVYLRRQDTLLLSVINETIKGGRMPQTNAASYKMDYDSALAVWANMFGKNNILVRPFEKSCFYQGTIFADFLHSVFNVELTGQFKIPKGGVNSSLHRVALEYKRLTNLLPLGTHLNSQVLQALQYVSERLTADGRADYPVLAPELTLETLRKHEEVNRQIAIEYLGRPDGVLFTEPLPSSGTCWEPYESLTPDDARYINQILFHKYPFVMRHIIGGIRESLSSPDQHVRQAGSCLLPGLTDKDASDPVTALDRTLARLCAAKGIRMTGSRAAIISASLFRRMVRQCVRIGYLRRPKGGPNRPDDETGESIAAGKPLRLERTRGLDTKQ